MTVRSISTPVVLLLGTLSLALSLAGCERPSAVRADGASASAAADTAYSPAAPADTSERNNRYDGGRSGERAEAPAPLLDGRPLWTSSRRGSAEENAQRAFARNGESFGASSLEAYVRKARTFIDDPPVASREGQPRAFFHPDQGGAYWETQKARETQARSARAGSDRASEG